VTSKKKLSRFFEKWGPECDLTCLEILLREKDKKGLEIFLDSEIKKDPANNYKLFA